MSDARLQTSGTRQPVLLRTSSSAGHGIGSSVDENVALWTDIDAFLLKELGAPVNRERRAQHYSAFGSSRRGSISLRIAL